MTHEIQTGRVPNRQEFKPAPHQDRPDAGSESRELREIYRQIESRTRRHFGVLDPEKKGNDHGA